MDIGRVFLATAVSAVLFVSSAFAELECAPVKDVPKDSPAFVISPAEIILVSLNAKDVNCQIETMGRHRSPPPPTYPKQPVVPQPQEEPKPDTRAYIKVVLNLRKSLDWQGFQLDHQKQPVAVRIGGTIVFAGDCPTLNNLEGQSVFNIEFPNSGEAWLFLQKLAAAAR